MSAIKQHVRRLNLDARVELFDIDLRALGGPVQRVSPTSNIIGSKDGRMLRVTDASTSEASEIETTVYGGDSAALVVRMTVRNDPDAQHFLGMNFNDRDDYTNTRLAVDGSMQFTARGAGSDEEWKAVSPGPGHTTFVGRIPDPSWVERIEIRPALGDMSSFPSRTESVTGSVDIVEFDIYWEDASGDLDRDDDLSDLTTWSGAASMVSSMPNPAVSVPVMWQGNKYVPAPMEAEGFELSGDSLPRPTMALSNALGLATRLCRQYRDLEGAEVTRWITYRRFLDDGASPDENAHLPKEIYKVDQKTGHQREQVEWELASALDQQGARLPARQVLRSACQLTYRVWDHQKQRFDYQSVSCPYSGGEYYTEDNERTYDPSKDRCNHQLSGCLKRFGDPTGKTNPPIPFGGFPAVGRINQ